MPIYTFEELDKSCNPATSVLATFIFLNTFYKKKIIKKINVFFETFRNVEKRKKYQCKSV